MRPLTAVTGILLGSCVAITISLAAVLAPVIGNVADRYSAHRIVLTLGVAGMGVAFASSLLGLAGSLVVGLL